MTYGIRSFGKTPFGSLPSVVGHAGIATESDDAFPVVTTIYLSAGLVTESDDALADRGDSHDAHR